MNLDLSDVFVGRNSEAALLSEKLSASVAGNGQVVLISGEAGIGKTRLLSRLQEEAGDRGVNVFVGRCRETVGTPPFWPWLNALAAILGTDSEVVTRLAGHGDSGDFHELSDAAQFRLFDSFASALRELATDTPTVIVLEDIHWADTASLQLLEFITPDIISLPILLACSFREAGSNQGHPLLATIGHVAREAHTSRVELKRFGRPEMAELFTSMSDVPPSEEIVDEALTRTGGNPLFAVELLKLIDAEGIREARGLYVDTNPRTGVPAGVAEVVARRLSALPPSSVEILQNAAILGGEFTIAPLAKMSDLDAEDLLSRLDSATSSGLVNQDPQDGTLFRFSHALVRDAIAQSLSVSDRARRHRNAAAAIESFSGMDIDAISAMLAHHYFECRALAGDEPAIKYSTAAGEQALSVYAYKDALAHFERVAELCANRPMDEQIARAHFGLGRARAFTVTVNERFKVGESLHKAFDYAISSGLLDLAVEVAMFPVTQHIGFRTEQIAMLERALDLVSADSVEAGYILNNLGHVTQFATGDFTAAATALTSAIEIGERHGDLNLQAQATAIFLDVRHHHNLHLDDDLDIALRSVDLARKCNNPDAEAKGLRIAAYYYRERNDAINAVRYAEQGLAAAERFRHGDGVLYAIMCLCDMLDMTGDWDRIRTLNDRALEIDERNSVILLKRVVVEHFTGSVDEEDRFFERLRQVAETSPGEDYYAFINTSLVAGITGIRFPARLEIGIKLARRALSVTRIARRGEAQARGGLAMAALVRRDVQLAQEVFSWFDARPEVAAGENIVSRITARLEALVGEPDAAVARIEPIYDEITSGQHTIDHALVCYEFAEVLSERGGPRDLQRAQQLLDEAEDQAERYGLSGVRSWTEVLRNRMADAEPTGDQPANLVGLSDREIEVLRLVAEGLSNPAIAERLVISRHTVVRHLANIFSKTGVSNRSEATAFAVRNGLG